LTDLYPFKSGEIEKIVFPDQMVGIWVNKIYKFYNVAYIEPLPQSDPLEFDLGALAAGANTGITQLQLLEMPDLEFGQFRAFVWDDICAELWQSRSDHRYKLNNRNARITRNSHRVDPTDHLTEFYVHEDDFAFVQVVNPTDYDLAQARICFYGFRYVLEKGKDSGGRDYTWNPGKPDHYVPPTWTRVPATAHL
jgi:hypothetical protein